MTTIANDLTGSGRQLIDFGKRLKRNSFTRNSKMTRAYFRSLRAAEMAAWEITGGDYVISGLFTHSESGPLAA